MALKIQTELAPEAIGPYSQGILSGSFIFVSGQLGLDPASGQIKTGIAAQTRQALDNLNGILNSAGTSLDKVCKVTIFLADMDDFSEVNDIYAAYFGSHKPARSCIAVAGLPRNSLVEIEAIAEK